MKYAFGLALALALPAHADVLSHTDGAFADFGVGPKVGHLTISTSSDEHLSRYTTEWGALSGPWRVYAPDGSYRESRAYAARAGFYAYSTDFTSQLESVLTMDKGFSSVLIEPWWSVISTPMSIRFSNGTMTGSLFLEDTMTGNKIDVTAGGVFQIAGAPTSLRLVGSFTGTPGRGLAPGAPGCGSFDCMIPVADAQMAFRLGIQALPILPAVPEPETYALMAAGLLGIALRHRARRAKFTHQ